VIVFRKIILIGLFIFFAGIIVNPISAQWTDYNQYGPSDTNISHGDKVPLWIKNNDLWGSENKITDSDFVKGIEFLVENKIIKVESESKIILSGPGKT